MKSQYDKMRSKGDMYIQECLDQIRKQMIWELENNKVKVEEAPFEDDIRKSTDALVKTIEGNMEKIEKRVAIRTRLPQIKFRDFTIRCQVTSGGLTEVDKIAKSGIDYYFYSWKCEDGTLEFVLLDVDKIVNSSILEVFRKGSKRQYNKDDNGNLDGTCFIGIPISELNRIGAIKDYVLKNKSLLEFDANDGWDY